MTAIGSAYEVTT